MIMKKLLTILLMLVLSNSVFSTGWNYWTGLGGNIHWTTSGNWSQNAYPGQDATHQNDIVVIGAGPQNIYGSVSIDNIPDGITINGLDIRPYVVGAVSLGTNVTLIGATSLAELHLHYSTINSNAAYSKYKNKIYVEATKKNVPDNFEYCSLNTNTGNKLCLFVAPSCMMEIDGMIPQATSPTDYNRGKVTLIDIASYTDCAVLNSKPPLWLEGGSTTHAELLQQTTADDLIYARIDWNLHLMDAGQVSSAHFVCSPITTNIQVGGKGIECRKANCLCVFDGSYAGHPNIGDYIRPWDPEKTALGDPSPMGDWGDWIGNHNCNDGALDHVFGKGYCDYAVTSGKTFIGLVNNASTYQSLPLGNIQDNGYALIGNPFPSGLFFSTNAGTVIGWQWPNTMSTLVYFWDGAQGTGSPISGAYRFFDWTDPTGNPDGLATPLYIPRGQGFFVEDAGIGGSRYLSVQNDARNFNVGTNIKSKLSVENHFGLNLLTGTGMIDAVTARFVDGATMNKSTGDAAKFFNSGAPAQIYTVTADDKTRASKTLPPTAGTVTWPVYVKVYTNGEFKITVDADKMSSFGSQAGIILFDRKTNTSQDLKQNGTYSFTGNVNDDSHRFDILFSNILNGITTVNASSFKIYSSGQEIFIQNVNSTDNNAVVTLYDMIGKQVQQTNISLDNLTKINTSLTTGYYIVSVKSNKSFFTQKVFIQ